MFGDNNANYIVLQRIQLYAKTKIMFLLLRNKKLKYFNVKLCWIIKDANYLKNRSSSNLYQV